MRGDDLPDSRQGPPGDTAAANSPDAPYAADDYEYDEVGPGATWSRSLTDDLIAIIDDGKTYAEAEIAFQKSRLAFAADRGKSVAVLGLLAIGLVHLALMALVVGAVIALSPVLTPWGATAVVVLTLLLVAALLAMKARGVVANLIAAYKDSAE